jgi:NAD(P)-dependent dehydrogenase (short-subunit alcohol dehydrogenase family)
MYKEPMLRDNALKGETFIVTGGGTGLGKSMSKYFLELGANVVICSRKLDILEATAEELMKETGGVVLPLQCDVREYSQVEAVLDETINKFGQVTGLVNNAAGNFISPTEKVTPKGFATVMGIVLQGTYNFTYSLGNHWIDKQQKGKILNIIATYAWTGSGYVIPSACSKAGVLAMTRSLAVEWSKYKIRVNAIAPGPFPTKGAWDRLFPKPVQDLMGNLDSKVPAGRVGEHQELANLAAYLMSDFSDYITGEEITIDGGEWLYGAGQFSYLNQVPKEMWDEIEKSVRDANKRG